MKKIENKKVTKKSLSHYCRAALLSLFVMLTIPSISSGVFGSGDAEAGCNPANSALTSNADMNTDLVPLLCGGSPTVSGSSVTNNSCTLGTTFAGITVCVSTAGNNPPADYTNSKCEPKSIKIRCVSFDDQEKCAAAGEACVWTVEDTQNNKLVDAVCRVYKIATGTAGKAFAAVGVISVGIGFFTGKVSWGLMISVAAGIAVFFGAPSIIAVISGDQSATALCNQVSQ